MAPDPRHLRAQRFPLHAAVESGDLARVRGLLEGPVRWAYFPYSFYSQTKEKLCLILAYVTSWPSSLAHDAGCSLKSINSKTSQKSKMTVEATFVMGTDRQK